MAILRAANLGELTQALVSRLPSGEKVSAVDLSAFNRLLEHTPEDMTATVEAGLTLGQLQAQLARRGQWLPVDPPRPERLTVGALLAGNKSGPRRFGYGLVREHLLGLKVVLANGQVIKAGGKVVKNVAGYDLCKLFVGSRGTLGIITEATFKLRPLPEAEEFAQASCDSFEQAGDLLERVFESELTPVVLDLNRTATPHSSLLTPHLVLGFAGARAEVDWQLAKARQLGLSTARDALQYERDFWSAPADAPVRMLSVLPSRLIDGVRSLGNIAFVARAGNGVIYYHGGPAPIGGDQPRQLLERVKQAFDPNGILSGIEL